jgi:hypothetical protein
MTLLQTALRLTAFRNPLLRTLVPTVALAYGIQGAVAVPSIAAQTERFYDLSGSLTYLSCTAVSLLLPYWRARGAGAFTGTAVEYLTSGAGMGAWRQIALSAAVGVWAVRCMSSIHPSIHPLSPQLPSQLTTSHELSHKQDTPD